MTESVSIIGCGRMGISLAVFLSRAGYGINGFSSRRILSAEAARAATGRGKVFASPLEAARQGGVLFLTTPDNTIEAVCSAIDSQGGFQPGMVVFHCSGALSSTILASAARAGAHTGSLHPLQSFAEYTDGQSSPFKGINMSVEGDEIAVALGTRMVKDLGASAFTVPTRSKTLYHAAAVVASNYLVTVEHAAMRLLGETGLDEAEAFRILEPLIQGTLTNIRERGPTAALTGPVARGDSEIIARHLTDIQTLCPEFADFYKLLGKYTLAIARARGGLDPGTLSELDRLLG
ncbi:MAG: Rossmann-like and DUF2520 domain-containing protein [Pseudomonadota bacterium]